MGKTAPGLLKLWDMESGQDPKGCLHPAPGCFVHSRLLPIVLSSLAVSGEYILRSCNSQQIWCVHALFRMLLCGSVPWTLKMEHRKMGIKRASLVDCSKLMILGNHTCSTGA